MSKARAHRDRSPIWTQTAPGQRRPKLTRDQIAEIALAIADSEGFEAISMRRIATELDVGTMTLYYYVRTKDDLVALMDDALMGEVLVPPGEMPAGWREALTLIARRSRDAFVRHPWALHSLGGAGLGPNGMRHMEQTLAAVAGAPLDTPGRLELISIVDDFVFGHSLRLTDAWNAGGDARGTKSAIDFTTGMLATGEFPNLEALLGDDDPLEAFVRIGRWMTDAARFERGLAALLDGVATRGTVPARAARPARPARKPRTKR